MKSNTQVSRSFSMDTEVRLSKLNRTSKINRRAEYAKKMRKSRKLDE